MASEKPCRDNGIIESEISCRDNGGVGDISPRKWRRLRHLVEKVMARRGHLVEKMVASETSCRDNKGVGDNLAEIVVASETSYRDIVTERVARHTPSFFLPLSINSALKSLRGGGGGGGCTP